MLAHRPCCHCHMNFSVEREALSWRRVPTEEDVQVLLAVLLGHKHYRDGSYADARSSCCASHASDARLRTQPCTRQRQCWTPHLVGSHQQQLSSSCQGSLADQFSVIYGAYIVKTNLLQS